jgi:hypothetical protein
VNPNYSQGGNSAANNAARVVQFITSADWGAIDHLRIGGGNTNTSFPFAAHWIDNLVIQCSTPFLPLLVGDYNNDGVVNAADYVVWRSNAGTTNVLPNDPIGGTIGTQQFDHWRANFGAACGGNASSINAAVPEPHTIFLVLSMAIVPVTARKRRRSKSLF